MKSCLNPYCSGCIFLGDRRGTQGRSLCGLNPYCSGCIFLGSKKKVDRLMKNRVLILIVVDVSF